MSKEKASGASKGAGGRSASGAGKPAGGRKGGKRTEGASGGRGSRSAASTARGESAQKRRLKAELSEAIEQIDEEGVLFLLQQAQVLIHNAQVERLNQEMQELQARRGKPAGRGKASEPAAGPPARGGAVRIDEADNRKSFFLDFGGVRKALSLPEMQRVVKICYSAESKSAALRQLYTVFSRERGDILADARIGGPASPLLDALFYVVREKYRLEER